MLKLFDLKETIIKLLKNVGIEDRSKKMLF
jgi:hypothetical protein